VANRKTVQIDRNFPPRQAPVTQIVLYVNEKERGRNEILIISPKSEAGIFTLFMAVKYWK
jgi:hypothetical protein